jgi:phage tail sheath protein FI
MPQYLTPGVYVEEVPSGSAPIAGASTSTPGFAGFVSDDVLMPVKPGQFVMENGAVKKDAYGRDTPVRYTVGDAGKPYLITSWEQFKNTFGDFQAEAPLPKNLSDANKTAFLADADNQAHPSYNGTLAHAVYGFFNNGGSRCWVVRTTVELSDAPPADPGWHSQGTPPTSPATAPVAKGETDRGTAIDAALNALKPIEEIALIAVPGVTNSNLKKKIYQHCETVGDRFAILDGSATTPGTMDKDGTAGAGLGTSNYAAVYYPWIEVSDPASNGKILVAPSGHVAGVYARVDAQRGVHKAPAAEVVRGATGLGQRVSRSEQDGLNPAGVNIIRDFDGNIKIWGARTLGGDENGEWKYINVRRTFLYLRKSIDNGTQWAVFEPNTPDLWAKIVRNITAFLTNVWGSGALFGNTPQEAFYVRCDATLNPPEVRDLGQVITEIGVSVVRPAEFVIFRISQWSGPGK